MLKLGRMLMLVVVSSFLFACASARMAQEVQYGKAIFNSGDFKAAFIQLLPLAVKCNAEAQYAVGYMYYYGLGVAPHEESGLFWITQSAAQMYRPAIKALQAIKKEQAKRVVIKHSVKRRYSDNTLTSVSDQIETKVQIAAIKKQLAPHEDPLRMATQATPQNKEDDVLASLKELKPQKITPLVKPKNKDNFTLQLFGSYTLDDVKKLQTHLKLEDKTCIAQTIHQGKDWYVLAYGRYPGVSSAKIAKTEMPVDAQKLKPWVRDTSELRWIG